MPVTELETIYSAIEESARLLNIPCSRDKVWPYLAAYGTSSLADAVINFAAASGEHRKGELDYSLMVSPQDGDPYDIALSKGFTPDTDHPVSALLRDIREKCPILSFGVDFGVAGGFKKAYGLFPADAMQGLQALASIPSMPRGLADNAAALARHGLDDHVTMFSVDYKRKTMNVYFGRLPAEARQPGPVLSLLGDIGLPRPSDQLLSYTRKSFSAYITVGWDSPRVARICFAVITTDPSLADRLGPDLSRFARKAPYAGDERVIVYGGTLSPAEEYYKVGPYYQIPVQTWRLLQAANALVEAV